MGIYVKQYRSLWQLLLECVPCCSFWATNREWKLGILKVFLQCGHWRLSRSVPIESPYATSYQWLIVTDILSRTVSELWHGKNFRHCVFDATQQMMRHNIWCSSWAYWKARSRLPISVNWTFFARCYGWVATSEKRSKINDFALMRSVWSKISGRRGRPLPIIFAHG